MSQRTGLRNVNSLRRKLRHMERIASSDIPDEIEKGARKITQTAKQLVPVDQGDLQASIEYKTGRDGFTAVIGPSAKSAAVQQAAKGSAFATRVARQASIGNISKKRLFQFFKGYWIEKGTKGNAKKNIPPQPARPFMTPAYEKNRRSIVSGVASAVNNQLKRFS